MNPTSPRLPNYVCPIACDRCLSSERFWLRFVDLEAVSWSDRTPKSKRYGENAVLKGSMVCLGPRCLVYTNVRICQDRFIIPHDGCAVTLDSGSISDSA